MAWSDQKQPASFRGAGFEVLSSALTAGRRLARHEYPQRDVPFMEDMGRRAREYKVEGYIIGPDYMAGRDQLLAAIEQEGSGQLVHPYHGTQLVTVSECELTESTEFGGMAKFTMTFVEAGAQEQPTVGSDAQMQLADTQQAAFDATQDDFVGAFSIDGLPSWGVGDIQKTIGGYLNLDGFLTIAGSVAAYRSNLGTLLGLPMALSAQLIALLRLLPDASEILNQRDIPFVAATGSVASASTRGVVQRQQAIVGALIKRTALIHQAGLLSASPGVTSAGIQTARSQILERFDAHDYAIGNPHPSAMLAMQLKAVRSAALNNLSRQSAVLPQTYALQLVEPQPALALSYALYGALRQTDIVARNAIRHPSFLPAGVPLQLTVK
jgi:prophage DNA circulation protein